MPIAPYTEGEVFEPETLKAMGVAFDRVCKELGLEEKDDPLSRIVARAIINKAQSGIHEVSALVMAVMDEFQLPPPTSL